MSSYNRVIIMGNLTRDPELRQSQSGTYIAKTGVAVNERVPDGAGGWRDETSFFDVVFFGKQAESFSKWFQKGRPVLVEGKLRQSSWEDRESGQKRSKVEIIGDRWHFVGGRDGQQSGGGAPEREETQAGAGEGGGGGPSFPARDDFVPDDVPF